MTISTEQSNRHAKAAAGKRPTKKAQLIKLLSSKAGADVVTLSEKLGWQHHSTRAAMSGLRKAGFVIVGTKPANGGLARYRIHSSPILHSTPVTLGLDNGA